MDRFLRFTKNKTLKAGELVTGTAEEKEPIVMKKEPSESTSESKSASDLYNAHRIIGGNDVNHSAEYLKSVYTHICDKLRENAESEEELDIYMITSFLKYYHLDTKHGHKLKYYFYCFKSLICALIQTLGMVAFLTYVIKSNWDEDKIECTTVAEWELRTVATLFSAYISVSVVNLIWELKNQGLYEHVAYAPPFLANEWLYIGLYCNAFTLMSATIGSFLLIYTADTTVDIVLNSLALYFIIELDNNLVDHVDYLRISRWMQKEFKSENYFSESQLSLIKFKKVCHLKLQVSGRKGGCNTLKLIWVFFGGLFVYLCIGIGCICAFAAPIVIAVCY